MLLGRNDALGDMAARVDAVRTSSGVEAVGLYSGTTTGFDSTGSFAANRFFSALGSRSLYSARSLDTPCKPTHCRADGG